MEIVEWANLVPLQLITWLEYIVVGGLALAAVYALWLNWKHRDSGDGEDWLDTETYAERRAREAAAKAATPQETAPDPAAPEPEPEPAITGTEPARPDAEPEPAATEPGDGR